MAYLAVNKNGQEVVFYGNTTPSMLDGVWCQVFDDREGRRFHFGKTLSSGTIFDLTGQKITFDDEPIKI